MPSFRVNLTNAHFSGSQVATFRKKDIEDITLWRKDMNFVFEW